MPTRINNENGLLPLEALVYSKVIIRTILHILLNVLYRVIRHVKQL